MDVINCQSSQPAEQETLPDREKESSAPTLTYQGRKTSRSNSEQRRRVILQAALDIVVTDGVRGVRHRAVAKKASVPLSATTYYFRDINDLITDTFTYFVEKSQENFDSVWKGQMAIPEVPMVIREGTASEKSQFVDYVSAWISRCLQTWLTAYRDDLIIGRAFQLECLRNEKLMALAPIYLLRLSNLLAEMFSKAGSAEPELAAQGVVAVVERIESQGLVYGLDIQGMRALLRQQLAVAAAG